MKNFKKIGGALLGCLLASAAAFGAIKTYANFVNNTEITQDSAPEIDLNAGGIGSAAAAAVYSSATIPSKTFTDGHVSTGSITVVANTGLTALNATNQITLPLDSAILPVKATDYMTVRSTNNLAGLVLTFNDGKGHISTLTEGVNWTRQGTATGTANAITTAWAAIGAVKVSSSGAVMYATATVAGVPGNAFTITSSTPSSISVNALHFSNGRGDPMLNAFITFNGHKLRRFYEWAEATTSTGTAVNIKTVLNRIGGIKCSTGTVSGHPVVFATATVAGTAANSFALTASSTNAFTVAGATFSGGRDAATIVIGGVTLTFGVDIATQSTAALTAKAISDAIMAKASLSAVIGSTWTAGGVVFATSTADGTAYNLTMVVSPTSAFTLSAAAMQGGADPAYTLNQTKLTIPSHGFVTNLQVLYSTVSATAISGLTNQTTYWVRVIDANTIALATSSAHAIAGDADIVLASSNTSTTATHSFTLTPLSMAGTPGFKWQASNDDTNWFDLSVASVTFATPYTAASTSWDFGAIAYRWIRLKITAPTTGALNLKINVNGKGLLR